MSIIGNWKRLIMGHTFQMGGGGSGGGPTNTTTQTSNIPDWLRPQVEAAIGATTQELFNTKNVAGTPDVTKQIGTDENGQPIMETTRGTPGTQEIQSIKGYTPYSTKGSDYVAGFGNMQNQAMQSIGGMQVPGQYGDASNLARTAGIGALGTTGQANMYGQQGSALSNMYGQAGAQTGQQYGGLSARQGRQGANIGQSLGQMSTDPNAVGAYMNPYLQNALNPALQLANQQYGIAGQQQQGAATSAGAFGGSRSALANSLNQQNQMLAQNQIIGQGYNQAFNNAQSQMNAANQAALAGNQQALTGYGQAGSQALQGYGMGLQGANQAANIGLQSVGAQQAGYGLANTAGQNLTNIGTQDLAARQAIANQQMQVGGQEQALRQQAINQDIQNFANKTVYPQQQLAFYNSMIRGYATPTQTTATYQAPPSTVSQVAGLGTTGIAGLGLYNAMSKG
jgi:hypothetical protein